MLEWMAGGGIMRIEIPTKRVKTAVPRARDKKAWAVQGTLQHYGTCDSGEVYL